MHKHELDLDKYVRCRTLVDTVKQLSVPRDRISPDTQRTLLRQYGFRGLRVAANGTTQAFCPIDHCSDDRVFRAFEATYQHASDYISRYGRALSPLAQQQQRQHSDSVLFARLAPGASRRYLYFPSGETPLSLQGDAVNYLDYILDPGESF